MGNFITDGSGRCNLNQLISFQISKFLKVIPPDMCILLHNWKYTLPPGKDYCLKKLNQNVIKLLDLTTSLQEVQGAKGTC